MGANNANRVLWPGWWLFAMYITAFTHPTQKTTSNAKEEIKRKKVTRSNAKKWHPAQKSHIQRKKADSTQTGYFGLANDFLAMDDKIQRKKTTPNAKNKIQRKTVTSSQKSRIQRKGKEHTTQTGKIQRKKATYNAKGASISNYVRKGCFCNQHPTQKRTPNAKKSRRGRDALDELRVVSSR